jgi:hypothetical protein
MDRLFGMIIRLIGIKGYLLVLLVLFTVVIYGTLSSPLRPGLWDCNPSNNFGYAIQFIVGDENFCKLVRLMEYAPNDRCGRGRWSYPCYRKK